MAMAINQAVIDRLHISEEMLVECLVSNMNNIFNKTAGIENVSKKPIVIDPINVFSDCVTALVGLAGTYSGLFSLHLPDILAKEFASGMLGYRVNEINGDVYDAIGELADLITGSLKATLVSHGNDIHFSTPSIFTGREYQFSNNAPDESLGILCDVGDQWFMVSLTLKIS